MRARFFPPPPEDVRSAGSAVGVGPPAPEDPLPPVVVVAAEVGWMFAEVVAMLMEGDVPVKVAVETSTTPWNLPGRITVVFLSGQAHFPELKSPSQQKWSFPQYIILPSLLLASVWERGVSKTLMNEGMVSCYLLTQTEIPADAVRPFRRRASSALDGAVGEVGIYIGGSGRHTERIRETRPASWAAIGVGGVEGDTRIEPRREIASWEIARRPFVGLDSQKQETGSDSDQTSCPRKHCDDSDCDSAKDTKAKP